GSHFSVIWPANAFLLATLLLYPPRQWLLFLLVGAMAYVAAQGQTGIPASRLALYFLYDCSVVVVTALTVRRFGAHKYDLGNVGRTVVVVAQISAATALMAWIWPLIHIFLGHDSHGIWLEWRHAFLSNLLPFLILTPGIVFGSTRSADLL